MNTKIEDALLTAAEAVLSVALPVLDVVTNILALGWWW